ncbi:hypothetical protein B0T22DRAFT_450172 [Podospora appendiculata]|uniref:Uncharacterized protein n=1 Tax=Podospora appendiculata TaxID=314037 RepID=A0AAE0XHP6_9PEZI|nr:hypothetical protein B0T22DRAFT_450172 [Podospora appendiculata]
MDLPWCRLPLSAPPVGLLVRQRQRLHLRLGLCLPNRRGRLIRCPAWLSTRQGVSRRVVLILAQGGLLSSEEEAPSGPNTLPRFCFVLHGCLQPRRRQEQQWSVAIGFNAGAPPDRSRNTGSQQHTDVSVPWAASTPGPSPFGRTRFTSCPGKGTQRRSAGKRWTLQDSFAAR